MSILVTGGAGYIGSHAVQRLTRDGHEVVAYDNLFRGHAQAIDRLRAANPSARIHFQKGDLRDQATLERVIRDHRVTAVMHFGAIAYVGESVTDPLEYYSANTCGSLCLLRAIEKSFATTNPITRMVFSSTCASYGEPPEKFIPIPETCPQSPINPYGWSKLHVERMLFDFSAKLAKENKPFGFAALRYFNVAGSDRTGLIGEHHEPETHLIPVILQAALGKRDSVTIFGLDYSTPDGTCIRDYVHVEDLIDAHTVVLGALKPGDQRTYNLGIGKGYSVLEIIEAVKRVTGKPFVVKHGERRPGDPPRLFADPRKIHSELGWTARITDLNEIVSSAWRWFQANPNGYTDK